MLNSSAYFLEMSLKIFMLLLQQLTCYVYAALRDVLKVKILKKILEHDILVTHLLSSFH